MELTQILLRNYLPYAKSTIVDRAIPSIDGLKPVQRRILNTMKNLNLLGDDKNKIKSHKIVGATMSVHPHGDSSIYEALVNMSKGHEGLNVPYIDSKGNFGKVYSKIQAAAPRYTEAKLAPICEELFEGIKENAVDFIDNFDGTEKEPVLLPAKFPNVLVNTVAGVAVGTSSYIPSFALKNVCEATIGVLNGTIKTPAELAPVLGIPEFTTGGHLHTDSASLEHLCATGKGSFYLSGTVIPYSDKIIITEIPYNTTADDIIKSITDWAKSGELREVVDVRDNTGLNGFKMTVELRRGVNSREVISKLARLTPLRTKISFRTRIVHNNRCKDMGLLELIQTWIEFRDETLLRIYTFRKEKYTREEHLLSTWEKINGHVLEVVEIISKNSEEVAKSILMQKFSLDAEQCEYLLDFRLRQLTNERAKKSLEKLAEIRNDLVYVTNVVNDKSIRKQIMITELTDIIKKYATELKTQRADLLVETNDKVEKAPISDESVRVILTANGYIKRLTTAREILNYECPDGDSIVQSWGVKNNEYILVFTYDGTVHKVLVDTIDAGRNLKELLFQKLSLSSKNDIMFVDKAGDFSGHFNLVYPNGRGVIINYSKASGPRTKYISLYEKCKPGKVFITKNDTFFIVTSRLKASYIDLTSCNLLSTRVAFKVARISSSEDIIGILDRDKLPAEKFIDFSRYNKEYTVKIGDDLMWRKPSDVVTGTLCSEADRYVVYVINKVNADKEARERAKAEKEKSEECNTETVENTEVKKDSN